MSGVQSLRKYCGLYAQNIAIQAVKGWRSGAFLLCGEDGDGLAALARALSARLLGMPTESAFDEHADIIVYPKPKDEKKQSKKSKSDGEKSKRYAISVDDIREIVDSLYLTPFEREGRIFIIENAETMSEVCQNKLLKSLEEPPPRVCFILCSSGRLLPTVESRCTRLELSPFSVQTVERELKAHCNDSGAAMLAARASRGNLALAERMLGDGGFADTYNAAKRILSLATGSKMFAHVAAVYEKFTRDKIDGTLDIIEYLLSDIARYTIGAETVFDSRDIAATAVGFTPYSATRCCEAVREAKKRNRANCMPQAVMDILILKIMEEKALCQK